MPRRRGTPLHDPHGGDDAHFSTSSWDAAGIATLEASGGDVRSALEAGLRAVLTLAAGAAPGASGSDRSSPIQGEGDSLAELFREMIEDFLDQLAFSPFACHDIEVAEVLHRDGGGYVAWGYAAESTAPAPRLNVPFVQETPTVANSVDSIVFRAVLAREEA